MPDRQLYVIAYDVCEPGRRRRAWRLLKDYAWGDQKSVFECFLTPSEKRELCKKLVAIMDRNEDRMLVANIPEHEHIQGLGVACLPRNESMMYVG